MKTTIAILSLLGVLIFSSCSKDEPVPQPQPQQQENPTPEPEPEPENQSPGSFSATIDANKNVAQLNWTAAVDPDGDVITYSIMLGDSLIGSQTETTLNLTNLVFEKDYEGKIIADDGNAHQVETSFSFTTGFLWLTKFFFDDFPSAASTYEYDNNEKLITLNRTGNSINVVYDNEGRLFSYDYFTYEWNETGQLSKLSDGSGNGDLIVLYNDQDQPKELKVTRTGSNNYNLDVTATLIYNGLGRLSIIDQHDTYSSDTTDGEQNFYKRIELRNDNVGNVAEKITRVSEDGIDYQIHAMFEYSYDDKKNPWYAIIDRQFNFNSRITLGINQDLNRQTSAEYVGGYQLHILLSEHNLTSSKYYNSELSLLDERRYEYAYNDSDYPISGKLSASDRDGQEEEYAITLHYLE